MHRSVAASLFAFAFAAGCAAETSDSVDFETDTGGDATGTAVEPRLVSRLTTPEGAAVSFLADPSTVDPLISIEISSPNDTPSLDALLAQEPSALELHLALAPDRAAPAELVTEHALLAQADAAYSATPRHLVPETVAGSSAVDNFTCHNNAAGWEASFDAWAPDLAGYYAETDTGTTSGYVGYAPKFYFDVCRTNSGTLGYAVSTQRRSNSTQPWSTFDSAVGGLGVNQRYRFYRNTFTCTSYQWRLYVVPSVGGGYHRGAKWANEWSCQIQG